ncbi:hypothetical protein HWV62_5941 [Athelia sp. TMB]|nr:hypothetical protein HWV62_5941 [Athelia sp. TMB]
MSVRLDWAALSRVLSAWVHCLDAMENLPAGAAYASFELDQAFIAVTPSCFKSCSDALGTSLASGPDDAKMLSVVTFCGIRFNPNPMALPIPPSTSHPTSVRLDPFHVQPHPLMLPVQTSVLAIFSTLLVLLIRDALTRRVAPEELLRVLLARRVWRHDSALDPKSAYTFLREHFDFFILSMTFSIFVGHLSTLGVSLGQIFVPYGYWVVIAGALDPWTLRRSASLIVAQLFEYMIHYLPLVSEILVPIAGALCLVFAFAVKENNKGGLIAPMAKPIPT